MSAQLPALQQAAEQKEVEAALKALKLTEDEEAAKHAAQRVLNARKARRLSAECIQTADPADALNRLAERLDIAGRIELAARVRLRAAELAPSAAAAGRTDLDVTRERER